MTFIIVAEDGGKETVGPFITRESAAFWAEHRNDWCKPAMRWSWWNIYRLTPPYETEGGHIHE